MKNPLTSSLFGLTSGVVVALSTVLPAQAAASAGIDLTDSLKTSSPFSSWTEGSRACNASLGATTAGILYNNTMAYDACIGSFSTKSTGNDVLGDGKGPLLDALDSGIFGGITDWDFSGKSDSSGSTVGDLGFQWTEPKEGQGSWRFQNLKAGFDADLVVSLKTANYWSAYYIKKGTISDFSAATFDWNTLGVDLAGSKTAGKGLSHASVFYANVSFDEPPQRVPEPSSAATLGLVALGLWRWGRRA